MHITLVHIEFQRNVCVSVETQQVQEAVSAFSLQCTQYACICFANKESNFINSSKSPIPVIDLCTTLLLPCIITYQVLFRVDMRTMIQKKDINPMILSLVTVLIIAAFAYFFYQVVQAIITFMTVQVPGNGFPHS